MNNVQFWVWQHQNPKWSMRASGKAQVEWDSPEYVSHERLISIGPTHTPCLPVCAHLVVWLARGHNHTSSSSSTLSTCVLRFCLRRRMKDEQNSVSLSDFFWDYAFFKCHCWASLPLWTSCIGKVTTFHWTWCNVEHQPHEAGLRAYRVRAGNTNSEVGQGGTVVN